MTFGEEFPFQARWSEQGELASLVITLLTPPSHPQLLFAPPGKGCLIGCWPFTSMASPSLKSGGKREGGGKEQLSGGWLDTPPSSRRNTPHTDSSGGNQCRREMDRQVRVAKACWVSSETKGWRRRTTAGEDGRQGGKQEEEERHRLRGTCLGALRPFHLAEVAPPAWELLLQIWLVPSVDSGMREVSKGRGANEGREGKETARCTGSVWEWEGRGGGRGQQQERTKAGPGRRGRAVVSAEERESRMGGALPLTSSSPLLAKVLELGLALHLRDIGRGKGEIRQQGPGLAPSDLLSDRGGTSCLGPSPPDMWRLLSRLSGRREGGGGDGKESRDRKEGKCLPLLPLLPMRTSAFAVCNQKKGWTHRTTAGEDRRRVGEDRESFGVCGRDRQQKGGGVLSTSPPLSTSWQRRLNWRWPSTSRTFKLFTLRILPLVPPLNNGGKREGEWRDQLSGTWLGALRLFFWQRLRPSPGTFSRFVASPQSTLWQKRGLDIPMLVINVLNLRGQIFKRAGNIVVLNHKTKKPKQCFFKGIMDKKI
ncbi:hypothetical protein BDK51DRAFT_30067 [Blyttiomyces helicus]|uniref:Uncharacterized protein n=1 Tax=Blyttiomyces helicus TaxID=388810 RepID=A0A4P9WCP3_9FUNG|nr:hypothetical protein BDK51DRAFT_30067 [Blyttiomyces helicus]|eukprot:RKO90439.1 hypothetical protein BDK51DRAFT_30067 [Blyttiomyces helicus]